MDYIDAVILGLVQGLSEFLPISSTAHIALSAELLGLSFPGLFLEIFLHLASLLALIYFFRADIYTLSVNSLKYLTSRNPIYRTDFNWVLYLGLGTLMTGVIGVSIDKSFGDALKHPIVIGVALIVTAIFLIFIERVHRYGQKGPKELGLKEAFLIGLGQSIAVLPGISRSGSTLIAALWVGLERETAVRFSFLLALPVIGGSSILMLRKLDDVNSLSALIGPLSLAFVVCFFASLVGIYWLIDFLKRSRLIYFAAYCFTLGLTVLAIFIMRDSK